MTNDGDGGKGRRAAELDRVVLIHGLGRSFVSMTLLATRLRRDGFEVSLVDYPSRRLNLDAAIRRVEAEIGERPAHLVGHSLGGLIALAIRRRGRVEIGRVVQIGAPNLGSGLAERVRMTALGRWWLGPVLAELGARGQRPGRDTHVAAIAGTAGRRWATRLWGLSGPNDGKVSVRSAWGRVAAHRAVAPAPHMLLPTSLEVARLVSTFLRTGAFPPDARRAPRDAAAA